MICAFLQNQAQGSVLLSDQGISDMLSATEDTRGRVFINP